MDVMDAESVGLPTSIMPCNDGTGGPPALEDENDQHDELNIVRCRFNSHRRSEVVTDR